MRLLVKAVLSEDVGMIRTLGQSMADVTFRCCRLEEMFQQPDCTARSDPAAS